MKPDVIISASKAKALVNEYEKMPQGKREMLRRRRLYELVEYARANSRVYGELYQELKSNFLFNNIPTMDKERLSKDLSAWPTDPEISLRGIEEFISNFNIKDNNCKPYLEKYYPVSSVGTEGNPIWSLYDKSDINIMLSIADKRNSLRLAGGMGFFKWLRKTACLYSVSMADFPGVFSSLRPNTIVLQPQDSTASIVNRLNAYKPQIIEGFPSVLERMCEEKKAGRLKASPKLIICTGEKLTIAVRARIEGCFKCEVRSTYYLSEAGNVAYECAEHHLHINDDWYIVEAMNKEGRPTKVGEISHHILLTTLFSYALPIIRYEINDRIIMHEEGCKCGCISPWIDIVGRSKESINLFVDGKDLDLNRIRLERVMDSIEGIKKYQIILSGNSCISLRLSPQAGNNKMNLFFKAEKVLRKYMKDIGLLTPAITLAKEEPMPDSQSGKYEKIISEI